MKLVITEDEVKEALMQWARGRYGNDFNEVDFNFSYSALQGATFWKKEPPAEPRFPAEPPADLPCNSKPQ